MPSNSSEFNEYLAELLLPPPNASVVEWAEEHVYAATGPKQGRFTTREIPYAREPINRFGEKDCKSLSLCFGSQSAKTTILIVGALYRVKNDPRDALWVTANADLAKGFSRERWTPWLKKCAPVYDLVPKGATGGIAKSFSLCNQRFENGLMLNFVGSNSPANLASRPCSLLILDEIDKYNEETKFEAGALALVTERTKAYAFPLVCTASTPTVAARGEGIWNEFLAGDQRYYYVPCPRCSQLIKLEFTIDTERHGECGVRWWHDDPSEAKTDGFWDMAKVVANAHYRCQLCGEASYEFERQDMLENGIWRPHNLNAPVGHYSYHLSSLYSVLSDATSLSSVAIKFLQSRMSVGGRQNFLNSWLAATFSGEDSVDQVKVDHEVYEVTATEGTTMIMFVDIQQDHFWVVIRRFSPGTELKPYGESWLVYANRVEAVEDLVALQKEHGVSAENVALDLRYKQNYVSRLICEHNWRGMIAVDKKLWDHPVPGGRIQRMYSEVEWRDAYQGSAWQARTFHRARYIKYCKASGLDLLTSLRFFDGPAIWHTTSINCHSQYQRHLNAFVKRPQVNLKTGRIEYIWVALHNQDHLMDCEVGCAIRALQLGLITVPAEISNDVAA